VDKQQVMEKAEKNLSPFETQNVIDFVQHLTFKSAMESPLFIGFFLVVAFYAVVKRSKPVLLFLFASIAIMFLVRFTLPADAGNELTVRSTVPFALGGLVIGGALIYFIFIKGD
jgi:hypothetical protein